MQAPKTQVDRILVRGTNWIGDAVMTIPALRRLRESFPGARISLVTTPTSAGIFEGSAFVDELLVYHRREQGWRGMLSMAQRLRGIGFDLALLFQNAFEAALLGYASRAFIRVGFAGEGRTLLLTNALPRPARGSRRHQVYDYLDLVVAAESESINLRSSANKLEEDPTPFLASTDEQRQAAAAVFDRHAIARTDSPLIALNAGATNSRAKCWPPDRFAALADRLIAETGGRVVLVGAPAERVVAGQVIAHMKQRGAVNLAGETDLRDLIGILSLADILVSNDTGPAHIAAALGRPVLTIFGPTNEYQTAPRGPCTSVLRAEGIECARCMLRDCPIDHRCMTRISSEEAASAALLLLERGRVSSASTATREPGPWRELSL
jgi:heptosyltransferase II